MKPEVDISNLCQAIYRSCLSLARPRENVNFMVRQYVGDNYAEEGAELRVPLNFMSLYHRVVLPKLVANNPQFSLTTWNMEARPTVKTMEDVGNEVIGRMHLGKTLERVASSALFSAGWLKVGIAKSSDVTRFSYGLKEGRVYAHPISQDDIAFDTHARTWEELGWIGHRYRIPVWKARERWHKDIQPTEDKIYTEMGIEKTAMISRGYYGQHYELEDMVDLWEVYVPSHNLIITLDAEDIFGGSPPDQPLGEEEWIGPKGSMPIHMLGFGTVPDNLMPKAPLADLITLHEDVNNLLRKQIMQAKDQKKVLPLRPGSEADGKRLQDTSNGEVFECSTPENLRELNFGGPDPQNFELMMTLKELMDWMAGNISAIGGLAPQAKTLGQEKLVTDSSNATVAEMQRRMVDFARDVGHDILWYLWNDPNTVHDQPFVLQGLDIAIPRQVTPKERRRVDFDQLKLEIEPFSLQSQTPIEVDAQLTQLVTQLITPMLPILQQQGVTFNATEFMQIKAKLIRRPELLRILSIQEPPENQPASSGADVPSMPANTQRSYERISRSERTPQGAHNERVTRMHGAAAAAPGNNGDGT